MGIPGRSRPVAADVLYRKLVQLAYNLRWTWESRDASLFASLAPHTWRETHNPLAVLRVLRAEDAGRLIRFARAIDDAWADLDTYLEMPLFDRLAETPRVAYLSAEFALASCLPIYAGGLGVLAGDHLKAASDLSLPVVGIGLLYRFGYFQQRIVATGHQRELYPQSDPRLLPLRPVLLDHGVPLRIGVPFPGRIVHARAWRADVGRVPLYLLDTDLAENREDDRWITAHLYGGDQDTRIRQEMVLGIGGERLLHALNATGLEPEVSVYHLNEGHSAFVVLELAREQIARGLACTFEAALRQVAPRVAFTTHTPVSAGHDAFSSELIERYLGDYAQQLGMSSPDLLRLGRLHPQLDTESFSMTVLALRGSSRRNAVSSLHGNVSRNMWTGVGVGASNESPAVAMDSITNGVHAPTWVGPEVAALFDSCLGRNWRLTARESGTWQPLQRVSRAALWRARGAQRARLLERANVQVDPLQAMVIGFARRFATYKRAGLLLEDSDRLARLLGDTPTRPVVIVFAGKAHPRDEPGKSLVQRIVQASRDERFRDRLAFLEDYDLDLARILVQGADIWLNTPRRPQEACGTSGMKAVMNGALQLSELDGWWDEAYRPDLGWALGTGLPEDLSDEARDSAEARELMDLLESQIVPSFYARDERGAPVDWLNRVVRSVICLAPRYSAERMVAEYASRVYWPAALDGASAGESD